MRTNKRDTALKMVASLEDQAAAEEIPPGIVGQVIDKDIHGLDDLFDDGGHVRCVHFMDIADEYATQFGQIESDPWDKKRWEVTNLAKSIFINKHN